MESNGFETSECKFHPDNDEAHRKQKPAANGILDDDEEQAGDVEDESNGGDAASQSNDEIAARSENLKPKLDLEIAAAKIDQAHLANFLVGVRKTYENRPVVFKITNFIDYFGTALSGVPCPWYDMFKEETDSLFDLFHLPISQIPEPLYEQSVKWINENLPVLALRGFVLWTFHYILDDMLQGPTGWKEGEGPTKRSKVAQFVALAMVLRTKPLALTLILPHLRKDSKFQGKGEFPLRIWMIAQASRDNLFVGLYSWAMNLLPAAGSSSNPQSRHLILKFVEKILLEPDAQTILEKDPFWKEKPLIPPPSLEILLRLAFPASSEKVEAASRFENIYRLLKKVALAGATKSQEIKQIFTLSLKLAGEENPELAKEATSIAISSLTKNAGCWKRWDNIYKDNLKASLVVLKELVEKWKDPSSPRDTLADAPKSKAMKQVTQHIFTLSLRLAGEGSRVLAKEATSIAIWSLTENADCWNHWDNIYKENLEASVVLLTNLVKKWKDHSLKRPGSEAMKQFAQHIFTFSLRLAGEGNPVLPKQATAIAIRSLSQIVDCCKRWNGLYTKNLKHSVALLKKIVDKWKEYSFKLSSSPSDTHSGLPPCTKPLKQAMRQGSKAMKQAMRQVPEQIFAFSLKLAKEGNPVLAKEATEIAIWSLTENVNCWKRWANLYTKNLEASVALLKKLVNEWKDHSLKLSSSPRDTLTLTQAINIFRLKNKNGITEGGGANGSLYKEADKSCKVILGRLSPGSSRLKCASITVVALLTAGATATALVLSSNPEIPT